MLRASIQTPTDLTKNNFLKKVKEMEGGNF